MAETKKSVTQIAASAEKKSAAKTTPASTEKKPAAKTTAASTEKKTVAKAAAASTVKQAAAKTTPKSTAAKKPVSKSTAKPAAAKSSTKKAAPAKKAPKKPSVTIDTICNKVEKLLPKKASFKDKVAVDIEIWGFEDGSNAKMYIEAKDGKVTVSPHTYDEKDFRVSVSFAAAKAFVDGKMTFKNLLASPDFYAEGNIGAAVKIASIF